MRELWLCSVLIKLRWLLYSPVFSNLVWRGGGTHKLKNIFAQVKSQQIYHWQNLTIIFEFSLRPHVPNEFPTNLLMGFVNGFCCKCYLLMGFCLFKGHFGKIGKTGQPHPLPIHYGSFDLFGPSGEFGTSGPMGVTHGTQKSWQKLIESNHSFDQIHSSATPPPPPPLLSVIIQIPW